MKTCDSEDFWKPKSSKISWKAQIFLIGLWWLRQLFVPCIQSNGKIILEFSCDLKKVVTQLIMLLQVQIGTQKYLLEIYKLVQKKIKSEKKYPLSNEILYSLICV